MTDPAHLPRDVVLELAHVFVQTGVLTWLQSHDRRHTLAAVCKGWCAVVSDSAALWTNITVHPAMSANFVELCLERSKSANINVVLTLRQWNARDHPSLVHSLPSIRIRDTPEFLAHSVSLLEEPFLRVVALVMDGVRCGDVHVLATAVAKFKAPKLSCVRYACLPVYGGLREARALPELAAASPLKRLRMEVVSPTWSPAAYSGLTCLHLDRGEGVWDQLCCVLGSARRLVILVLAQFRCAIPVGATVVMIHLHSFQLTYSQIEQAEIARAIDAPNVRRVRFEACGMASLSLVLRIGKHMLDIAPSVDLFATDDVIGDLTRVLPELRTTTDLDVSRCGTAAKDAILALAIAGEGLRLEDLRELRTSAHWSAQEAQILFQTLPDGCRLSGASENEHVRMAWTKSGNGVESNEYWYNHDMYTVFGDN
ncbi:hypothetical protein C8R47DRAFT_1224731 [Mycena vitilis]|nr:hypothetical protein C8R47DRAFT_1224731 [Mycena vitilis]